LDDAIKPPSPKQRSQTLPVSKPNKLPEKPLAKTAKESKIRNRIASSNQVTVTPVSEGRRRPFEAKSLPHRTLSGEMLDTKESGSGQRTDYGYFEGNEERSKRVTSALDLTRTPKVDKKLFKQKCVETAVTKGEKVANYIAIA